MYGSLSGWQAYVEARDIANQSISDPGSIPVLVRASDYIKYHYVVNFMPQYDDTVPEVELATYEAACIENTKPGFFERTYSPGEAKMLVAVDSIRWEKVTASRQEDLDNNVMVPISTKIDMYLRRYMRLKGSCGLRSIGSVS